MDIFGLDQHDSSAFASIRFLTLFVLTSSIQSTQTITHSFLDQLQFSLAAYHQLNLDEETLNNTWLLHRENLDLVFKLVEEQHLILEVE